MSLFPDSLLYRWDRHKEELPTMSEIRHEMMLRVARQDLELESWSLNEGGTQVRPGVPVALYRWFWDDKISMTVWSLSPEKVLQVTNVNQEWSARVARVRRSGNPVFARARLVSHYSERHIIDLYPFSACCKWLEEPTGSKGHNVKWNLDKPRWFMDPKTGCWLVDGDDRKLFEWRFARQAVACDIIPRVKI